VSNKIVANRRRRPRPAAASAQASDPQHGARRAGTLAGAPRGRA